MQASIDPIVAINMQMTNKAKTKSLLIREKFNVYSVQTVLSNWWSILNKLVYLYHRQLEERFFLFKWTNSSDVMNVVF